MNDKSQLKCELIQTKVNAEAAERVRRVAERLGFGTPYNLLQHLIAALLNWAEPEYKSDASADMVEMAKLFADLENHKEMVNDVRPSADKNLKIASALYIMREGRKTGYSVRRLRLCGQDIHTSANRDAALEEVLKKLFPKIATQIDGIAWQLGTNNYTEVISYLLEQITNVDKISRDIQSAQAINAGGIEYGTTPVRKHYKTVNNE